MANPLMSIPGLGGYLAQEQMTNDTNIGNLNQAVGMQGLLEKTRQRQEFEQAVEAVKGAANEEEGIARLQKLGTPTAFKMANEIAQVSVNRGKMAQDKREQAVFTPENIAANTLSGQPARPEEVMPEGIAGPPTPARAAVAPQVNIDALRQQAAMTGPKGLEAYSTHLAASEQAKATRAQTFAFQMAGLQERAREADQRSKDRTLDRQARSDAQAEARQLRRDMMALAAPLRQPPAGVAVLGADGKPVFVERGQEIGKTPAPREPAVNVYSGSLTPGVDASGKPVFVQPSGREGTPPRVVENVFPPKPKLSDREEQKGAMADYAETLVSRLETLLDSDPRSTTGMFSAPVRGVEAITNAVVPGAIGSQATIAKQTKEQLISVLGQVRGGGAGRLSNQDMRRVDTAIGQLNTGTPEGMAQGLKDARELINTMKGGGTRPQSQTPTVQDSDRALIEKYLPKPER